MCSTQLEMCTCLPPACLGVPSHPDCHLFLPSFYASLMISFSPQFKIANILVLYWDWEASVCLWK